LTNLAILYSGRGDIARTQEMVDMALPLERDEARRKALLKLLEPREEPVQQP
jgi:hypothetical protein